MVTGKLNTVLIRPSFFSEELTVLYVIRRGCSPVVLCAPSQVLLRPSRTVHEEFLTTSDVGFARLFVVVKFSATVVLLSE